MIIISAQTAGHDYSLEIKGHAAFAGENDIVCAGVSALYYALLAALAEDRRTTGLCHEEKDGNGKTTFVYYGKRCDYFVLTCRGLSLIAQSYPENVKMLYKKGKGKII